MIRVPWRIIITFVLATTITMGVSGCMWKKTQNNNKNKLTINERMMKYINERYDDTFTFLQIYENHPSYRKREILVTTEKYPGEYIHVQYIEKEEGDFYNDNYLYFKYRDQAIEALHEVFDGVLDYDFKFFYEGNPGVDMDTIDADATFDEYISNTASNLRFTVVVAPGYSIGEPDVFEKRIIDAFASQGMVILSASIHFCDDPDVYEELDRATLLRFVWNDTAPVLHLYHIGTERADPYWR